MPPRYLPRPGSAARSSAPWRSMARWPVAPPVVPAFTALMVLSVLIVSLVLIAAAVTGAAMAQEAPTSVANPGATVRPTPGATVRPSTLKPGVPSRYVVQFTTAEELDSVSDGIVMTLHADIRWPRAVNPLSVLIRADAVTGGGVPNRTGRAIAIDLDEADDPRHPTVLTIYFGDLDPGAPGAQNIAAGAQVTVTITQQAGLSNPTEGGSFDWIIHTTKDATPLAAAHPSPGVRQAFGESPAAEAAGEPPEGGFLPGLLVARQVELSDEIARRGDEIVAIGRGFKNDTTLTFWRDGNGNGRRDTGEIDLCRVTVEGNDIATCTFKVSSPPFRPGRGSGCDTIHARPDSTTEPKPVINCNLVNAVDGRNNASSVVLELEDDTPVQILELEGTVSIGSRPVIPGRKIQVQLSDFFAGSLKAVDIGGVPADFPSGVVNESGSLNFSLTVPDRTRPGLQSLRVVITRQDNGEDYAGRATVIIGSPIVRVTPEEIVPNQLIRLSGNGFAASGASAGSDRNGGGNGGEIATISIGGVPIDPSRINGGNAVRVDRGGNWSASVDLPLNAATTNSGRRQIRVLDQSGREGSAPVTVLAREVTITPAWGAPGTTATVRGKHFPARNDNGSGFNLLIVYDHGGRESLATAETDAGGRFETKIVIPNSASVPSTNRVRVEFLDDDGIRVVTLTSHDVPGAAIVLSPTVGPPGTGVTLSGNGFKRFVPITSVMVGDIEVTPSPLPKTNEEGRVELKFLIPGSGTGLQAVEVRAGGITATAGLTISPSGVAAGNAVAAADAVRNLGSNFVRSFSFNNDTKTWTFFAPAAGDASTQKTFITGEPYWLLVREGATVILNHRTRNLTCSGGNCWNRIVW